MKRILLLAAFLLAGCETPPSIRLERLNAEINTLRNKINGLAEEATASEGVCSNYKVLTKAMDEAAPKLEAGADLLEEMGRSGIATLYRERAGKIRSGVVAIRKACS